MPVKNLNRGHTPTIACRSYPMRVEGRDAEKVPFTARTLAAVAAGLESRFGTSGRSFFRCYTSQVDLLQLVSTFRASSCCSHVGAQFRGNYAARASLSSCSRDKNAAS
jgi:hypothetical protein